MLGLTNNHASGLNNIQACGLRHNQLGKLRQNQSCYSNIRPLHTFAQACHEWYCSTTLGAV